MYSIRDNVISIWGNWVEQRPKYLLTKPKTVPHGILFKEDDHYIYTDGNNTERLYTPDPSTYNSDFMRFCTRIPILDCVDYLEMAQAIDYDNICLNIPDSKLYWFNLIKFCGRQLLILSPRTANVPVITCFENVGRVLFNGEMIKINDTARLPAKSPDRLIVVDLSSADYVSFIAAKLSLLETAFIFRAIQRLGPGAIFGPGHYYNEFETAATRANYYGDNYEEMTDEWQTYLIGRGRFTKPAIRTFE